LDRRQILGFAAIVLLFVSGRLPASVMTDVMEYLALGYILIDVVLRVRAGYLRRRPHWTQASWRRYLAACTIPIGALLLLVGMMVAFEFRLSVVGDAGSTTRALWTSGMVVFMLVGAVGLAAVIDWLAQGEPSKQFAWPRWWKQSSSGPDSIA